MSQTPQSDLDRMMSGSAWRPPLAARREAPRGGRGLLHRAAVCAALLSAAACSGEVGGGSGNAMTGVGADGPTGVTSTDPSTLTSTGDMTDDGSMILQDPDGNLVVMGADGSLTAVDGNVVDEPAADVTTATTPTTTVTDTTTPADPNAAGLLPLRHFTSREYRNTVVDLLGDRSLAEDDIPTETSDPTFSYFPFRQPGWVSVVEVGLLRGAAEQIAANAAANLGTLLPCSASGDAQQEATCAGEFINSFGKRAYRRPLVQREVDSLNALYQAGRADLSLDFNGAIQLLIEAILQAPAFYYHWEDSGQAPTVDGEVVALNPYMLASRLSYFLWGSMPDDALLAAADAGQLSSEAQVEQQVRRMLDDPRARDMVQDFADDLLDLDSLLIRPKDASVFPMYNQELQDAMRTEAREFAASALLDGPANFTALMTGVDTALNQPLAAVYGVDNVRGNEFTDATLNPGERGGILTLAAFLANTGSPTGSVPPRRGKVVFNRFLCTELPPPPAEVPAPAEPAEGLSTRQRFEQHNANPCAAGCHGILDGIGFAFEHYDGIGGFRDMDMGVQVDASSSFSFDGTTVTTYADAVELGSVLAAQPMAQSCFAKQWLRYALNRLEEPGDQASLQAAEAAFTASDGNVREIITAIATSRTFRFRAPAPGEVLQ